MTESKELGQLFKQAQAAFDKREWSKAVDLLMRIIRVDASYPGAYDLLIEAQKRQRAEPNYEKGLEYYEEGNWVKAIEEFETALRDDPDHSDARTKLEEARRRAEIEQLASEADEYQRNSEWKQAVDTLERLLGLQDSDLDFDWESVKQQLTEAQEECELARIYRNGEQHFDQERWRAATQSFEELERRRAGYRDVALKLKVLRKLLKLEELYHQAREHEQAAEWAKAVSLYDQVYEKDHHYKDVVDRMAHCNEQLKLGTSASKVEKTSKWQALPWYVWFLLGFLPGVVMAFLWARSLYCLLTYRVTDAIVGLIVILFGSIAINFTDLVPSDVRKALQRISGGAASALLLGVLMVFSSPPREEECFPVLTAAPTFTPTSSLVRTSTPKPQLPTATTTAPTDIANTVAAQQAVSATATDVAAAVNIPTPTLTDIPTVTADVDATVAARETETAYAAIAAVEVDATAEAATVTAEVATSTAKAVTAEAMETANAAATQTAIAATATADCAATRGAIGATATAEAMRPVPLKPKAGTLFPHGGQIHFTWRWYRELDLEKNEHFAVRLWHKEKPDEKHSLTWVETTEYILDLSHPPIDDIDFTKGDYYWNVAALGQPDPYHKPNDWKLIAESEPVEIYINVPTPEPTDTPTPLPTPTTPPIKPP